jgi:MFS family permease
VGPLVAALLLKFVFDDERSVFLLAAIPGIAGVALVIFGVRERTTTRPPAAPATTRVVAPLPRRFWVVIGIFVLFTLASSTDAFLLLRAQDTGVAVWQLPLLWAFFNGMKAMTGVPGGILADRFGRIRTITAGWIIYVVAYVGFAFLSRPALSWGLFAFYALFYALTEGAERALVADLVPAELRGRAFGAFHASVGLASLPASILFGVLWKVFGAHVAFLTGAAVALIATACLLAFGPRRLAESRAS